MLDQLIVLFEHFGHVRHVAVADVRAEQRFKLNPERVDLPVEGPDVQRIVGFVTEVEVRASRRESR